MNQRQVTFLPHNRTIEVSEGDSLIRAALQAGVHINASCGGEGVCGKCRILLEEGMVSEGVSERLSQEDLENGYRLACLSRISEDATIRVPVESAIDRSVFDKRVTPRRTARIKQMDFESLKEQGLFI
ncbi:MAG: 2Fe-2S iron-sulfur cluster binding domain-containing protein, partial [Desulfobacterales bacterium]|nr:2Fe-2S iron-sulfur cluster binding domain-containing protein [Desulfobacterales bacterium]